MLYATALGLLLALPASGYLSPAIGRFINRDPIEEKGGLNAYAFVTNNPVNKWDHLGMVQQDQIVAVPGDDGDSIFISGTRFTPGTVSAGSSRGDGRNFGLSLSDIQRSELATGGTYIGTDRRGNLALKFASAADKFVGLGGFTEPADQDRLVGQGDYTSGPSGSLSSYHLTYFTVNMPATVIKNWVFNNGNGNYQNYGDQRDMAAGAATFLATVAGSGGTVTGAVDAYAWALGTATRNGVDVTSYSFELGHDLTEFFSTVAVPEAAGLRSASLVGRTASAAESRGATLIEKYLGPSSKAIKNEAGDLILVSEDGAKRVRFDFNRPYPHESPHAHVEELVNGKWQKSGPIYPTDVPHK